MSQARDLQTAAWDAECRRDVDTLVTYFHPDATFHPAGQAPQKGHAAIRELTEDFYRSFPELEIDILNEWGDGASSAAFEFRAYLTDTEGGRSTLDGICLVEIADGVFTSVRYYEDAPVPVTG
ncbi:hypothetical protein JCM18899A_07710 [Nocardioides sp. AN3]